MTSIPSVYKALFEIQESSRACVPVRTNREFRCDATHKQKLNYTKINYFQSWSQMFTWLSFINFTVHYIRHKLIAFSFASFGSTGRSRESLGKVILVQKLPTNCSWVKVWWDLNGQSILPRATPSVPEEFQEGHLAAVPLGNVSSSHYGVPYQLFKNWWSVLKINALSVCHKMKKTTENW